MMKLTFMKPTLRASALLLVAMLISPDRAAADFWTRVDRPWSHEELERAMAFRRIQPRVDARANVFVDMVEGVQIDKCMRALGWVGVAR